MEDRKNLQDRRSRLLVDKPFQYSLMRLLGAVWLLNTVLLGGLIYYLYAGPIFRVDHLAGEPNIQRLPSQPPQLGVLMTFGAVAGLVLVTIVGLHMSHQIAGPLAQLKARLRELAQGDLGAEVRFRAGDYLVDLPDHFNGMIRVLRARAELELQTLRSIEAGLDEGSHARAQLRQLIEDKEALLASVANQVAESGEASDHADPLPALES